MGRQQANNKVPLTRLVLKVNTNRELNVSECSVKIKNNSIKFLFDKYNQHSQLKLELVDLFANLDIKGITKKISNQFAIFLIKKPAPYIKWTSLYKTEQEVENNQQDEDEINTEEDILCEQNDNVKELTDNMGFLTNELVDAVCTETPGKKIDRRQSRTKSLAKNIKSIMSKYGQNRSKRRINKEGDQSQTTSKKEEVINNKKQKELESFLLVEERLGSKTPESHTNESPFRFGSRSTELINRPSMLLKPTNHTIAQINKYKHFKSSTNITTKKKSPSKNKQDFKVLTIDELIERQKQEKANPFKKQTTNETSIQSPVINHNQMNPNMFDKLKKSRKSITTFDMLSFAKRNLESKKKLLQKANNAAKQASPEIAKKKVSHSSKPSSKPPLPISSISKIKSQRVLQQRRKIPLKKSYYSNNSVQKSLTNIKKSITPAKSYKKASYSQSKVPQQKSRSRAYVGNKSSVVFTKPKVNKKVPQQRPKKMSQKSPQYNYKSKSRATQKKMSISRVNYQQELESVCDGVKAKQQEIFDSFAKLSLDMGWIHKQCRNMDLKRGKGVLEFVEMQNRLIIKLAEKLKKEKTSRYRVEQQCQHMMQKFTKKIK
jgi:hypothetical protein